MTKTIFFSIYLSVLAVITQILIFKTEAIISVVPVFIYSWCAFALLLSKYRWLNSLIVAVVHMAFLILLVYHHFFTEALTLNVAVSQWKEGAQALLKAHNNMPITYGEVLILLSMAVSLCFSARYQFTASSWKMKTILICFFALSGYVAQQKYDYENFSPYEFNVEAKYFGYPVAWGYEVMTHSGQQKLAQKLEENSDYEPLREFEGIPSADNIYIIQFESFDYNAVHSGAMPFLRGIIPQSAFYKIKPHFKKASANADFQVLALHPIYNESIGLLYKTVEDDYFKKHGTLPRLLKEKGYKSYFYHGNDGDFFHRRQHIEQMGFDEIYFKEDLDTNYPSSEWGINDQSMADFISKQPQTEKSLHFFITVSSHFDFSWGKTYAKFIKAPETLREMYLNTINYTDGALQKIIETAPENSIFFIYADHDSETTEDKTTAFIIYHKNKPIAREGIIEMQDIPTIIYQIIK